MDTTEKFNNLALVYYKGRPEYVDEFLADLYRKYGCSANSVIADIGSGTDYQGQQSLPYSSTSR